MYEYFSSLFQRIWIRSFVDGDIFRAGHTSGAAVEATPGGRRIEPASDDDCVAYVKSEGSLTGRMCRSDCAEAMQVVCRAKTAGREGMGIMGRI